jgi:hypothetical protein
MPPEQPQPFPARMLQGTLTVLLACLLASAAQAQGYILRGTVTDGTTGETLVGASVKLKEGTASAVTDIDGRFQLRVEQLPPFTLVVSYMG